MSRSAARSSYRTLSLPLDAIEPHPDNDYSMEEDELEELVASIASDGLASFVPRRRTAPVALCTQPSNASKMYMP
ncbi:hypothetical protein C1878_00200 [Gordonibacter sp. 28C]|uniref:ParB/RepB/Spo0J family partition protein n=1 Tax=Gordonibacter sp. 28C TaxID=2078569 RepID=UPI000E187FD0|nr:ParB/RepB/Spo0J family partition protein [Gordonibacter sp. 28C]RDB64325.1 hypothetical protein C1878_00200 [Gordonibacter sp. 28C]